MNKPRYKWTKLSTNVLIALWSNEKIQKELNTATRTQPIWNSIAGVLSRKGFPVTGWQCRVRIKNMTSLYQTALLSSDEKLIEPYFDVFRRMIAIKNARPKKEKPAVPPPQPEEIMESETSSDLETLFGSGPEEVVLEIEPEVDVTESSSTEREPEVDVKESSSTEIESDHLESLIRRTVATEIAPLKKTLMDAIERIESVITAQSERMESILAREELRKRQQDMRISRLLNRLDAMAVPQLTYMGDLIAERKAAAN